MSRNPGIAVYLTHPEVEIDPDIAVTDWALSVKGAARVTALAKRLGALLAWDVVSSAERKALETAWPLAAQSGRALRVLPRMHENDRSATGYLPRDEFETLADAFFADCDRSARGWETARQAQARIVAEVTAVIAARDRRNVLFTGHGAVGTLLYCHLAECAIDRKWDQPAGGSWFAFDIATRKPVSHWMPMENLTLK